MKMNNVLMQISVFLMSLSMFYLLFMVLGVCFCVALLVENVMCVEKVLGGY